VKSKKGVGFLVSVLCTLCVCTAPVEGISIPLIDPITHIDSGWAMVVRSELLEGQQVDVPYVYGVIDDAVAIQLDKTFSRPFSEDGFNYPIIIEFEKTASDATPNIIIREEFIRNETGMEWIDYHMHLIVDALNPQAGFDPTFFPDGDQLEDVYYTSNYGYGGLPIQLHFVDTDGSGVLSSPPYEQGENVFQPGYFTDITDSQIVIVTDPGMAVGEHFGLKEIPTIPEPATVCLLGLGALGILRKRRKGHIAEEKQG